MAVQPDVINASIWARKHLGINQPFAATVIDSQALATYGLQDTVDDDNVWPIFFSPTMNASVAHSIRAMGVRYVLVDWRMIEGRPLNPGNYYFSPWEPNAESGVKPFPAADLRKFVDSPCIHMIYNTGMIQIINVTSIDDGSCLPNQMQAAHHRAVS